ncbi:Hypothetical protein POVN_LOCUS582 [uncultured virus]|nr:Hypothetical protein POVN_LOCUS582 [uncultured virus]
MAGLELSDLKRLFLVMEGTNRVLAFTPSKQEADTVLESCVLKKALLALGITDATWGQALLKARSELKIVTMKYEVDPVVQEAKD